jgi:hypothetical protein
VNARGGQRGKKGGRVTKTLYIASFTSSRRDDSNTSACLLVAHHGFSLSLFPPSPMYIDAFPYSTSHTRHVRDRLHDPPFLRPFFSPSNVNGLRGCSLLAFFSSSSSSSHPHAARVALTLFFLSPKSKSMCFLVHFSSNKEECVCVFPYVTHRLSLLFMALGFAIDPILHSLATTSFLCVDHLDHDHAPPPYPQNWHGHEVWELMTRVEECNPFSLPYSSST